MPINKNIYNVNWNKLTSWLIPTVLFKPKMFAWCKSLVAPISTLHGLLISFRSQKLYELSVTSQVCKLQKLLNDYFDESQRRIYIDDGVKSPKKYVFKQSEFVPLSIYTAAETTPTFIYTTGEVAATVAHFVVNIPTGLSYDVNVLKSILNIYKLPSRKYKIQAF